MFEFGCAVELFALERPELGVAWYRHAICAAEPGPLRGTGGAGLFYCFAVNPRR